MLKTLLLQCYGQNNEQKNSDVKVKVSHQLMCIT